MWVFYYVGYGVMDEVGVFYLLMGVMWVGVDVSFVLIWMWFGVEKLCYMFWLVSELLCVVEGYSLMCSWVLVNCGLCMMFGFEFVLWDSGSYGWNFWCYWVWGKGFV